MNQDDLDELGPSNVSVDPQFVNLVDRDLRLSDGTPANFNGAELGLYGGAGGKELSFIPIRPEITAFCELVTSPGDDDDDASDDDDSGGIGTGNGIVLPSGLRCTNCDANMTGASASTGLLLLPLVAVRRRRKR
jgi:hypothetical protein